jgi:hypothetical protein
VTSDGDDQGHRSREGRIRVTLPRYARAMGVRMTKISPIDFKPELIPGYRVRKSWRPRCEQFCSGLKTCRRHSSIFSVGFPFAFFHAALPHERS